MSVNERKWLVMHMHVQLKLDELRGPPKPLAHCDMTVPSQLLPFFWHRVLYRSKELCVHVDPECGQTHCFLQA